MFKNYCDCEEAIADRVLDCADKYKKKLYFNDYDLKPAFIRKLWFRFISQNQSWCEKNLLDNYSYEKILLNLSKTRTFYHAGLENISGLRYFQNKFNWLNFNSQKIIKNKTLIIVRNWKHANYLKKSKFFNELNPLWLVDSPKMAFNIGLNKDDLIVPFFKPFFRSSSIYPLNELKNLLKSLETTLLNIKPSSVFVVEGDAPYHALLAEIGIKLNIPVYCFQWGVFHQNKLRTAFSHMRFKRFLSWGPAFKNQLKTAC